MCLLQIKSFVCIQIQKQTFNHNDREQQIMDT
jgi:hypothetical protein